MEKCRQYGNHFPSSGLFQGQKLPKGSIGFKSVVSSDRTIPKGGNRIGGEGRGDSCSLAYRWENRKVKHHVYVKRQTRICIDQVSLLLAIYFSLFLHKLVIVSNQGIDMWLLTSSSWAGLSTYTVHFANLSEKQKASSRHSSCMEYTSYWKAGVGSCGKSMFP